MELAIREMIRAPLSPITYYKPLRHVLEEHYHHLLESAYVHEVDAYNAQRFRHDINGYLMDQGIPLHLHWLYMRMNDMVYPTDFKEDTKYLIYPDNEAVERIIGDYMLLSNLRL